MKKLLFIAGNRQNLDKENVKNAYAKIKAHGFIPTMQIEYITMAEAKELLKGKSWKTHDRLTPEAKFKLALENFLILTP